MKAAGTEPKPDCETAVLMFSRAFWPSGLWKGGWAGGPEQRLGSMPSANICSCNGVVGPPRL